jgi:hypothetical protein
VVSFPLAFQPIYKHSSSPPFEVNLSLNPHSCDIDEKEKHFFLLPIAGIVKNYTNASIHSHFTIWEAMFTFNSCPLFLTVFVTQMNMD